MNSIVTAWRIKNVILVGSSFAAPELEIVRTVSDIQTRVFLVSALMAKKNDG